MNRTQQISRVVRTLSTLRGESQQDIARVVKVDPATISRRSKTGTGDWTAEELEALAEHFGAPVTVFLKDPDELWDAVIQRYPSLEWAA